VPESQIKLYYKNVTAEVIGNEHGITEAQLKALAKKDLAPDFPPEQGKKSRSEPDLDWTRQVVGTQTAGSRARGVVGPADAG
jgi:hypothetical protein